MGLNADDLNKFRSDDQKMKLRLLKSAALVPTVRPHQSIIVHTTEEMVKAD